MGAPKSQNNNIIILECFFCNFVPARLFLVRFETLLLFFYFQLFREKLGLEHELRLRKETAVAAENNFARSTEMKNFVAGMKAVGQIIQILVCSTTSLLTVCGSEKLSLKVNSCLVESFVY